MNASSPLRANRLLAALLGIALAAGVMPAGEGPARVVAADPPVSPRVIPKVAPAGAARDVLRGGLAGAAAAAEAGRPVDLRGVLRRAGTGASGADDVGVVVEVRAGTTDRVAAGLRRHRGTVAATSETTLEGYLPLARLADAAVMDGVVAIRPIYRRLPGSFVTPAIVDSNAPAWHAAGRTGQGISVGVLDGGFEGIRRLLGAEIPAAVVARCFPEVGVHTSDLADCENGIDHGTAVAELVVDMAPGARLYVANPESPADYRETIRWMAAEGVRVFNASTASGYLFDGPGDGTAGRPDSTYEEVDLAVAAGGFWVNSAGNEGETGWTGPWRDDDADDSLDWAPGDDTNTLWLEAGTVIRVAMRWADEWGGSANDYDIALFRGDEAVAAGSDFQDGEGDPYEVFEFLAAEAGAYDLVVRRFDAEPVDRLDVLIYAAGPIRMEHRVAAGTLPAPADSANPGMVSVGAVDAATPDEIQPYSSRGPTVDGRIKPDLVAPDCMATLTFGHFCGTSASAPMTAGGAALLLQAEPTHGPVQLAERLRATARPLGEPVPNGTYGSGRLALGAPSTDPSAPVSVALGVSARTVTWPEEVTLTATLSRAIPGDGNVHFHASPDGRTWTWIGSAPAESGRTAALTISPIGTRQYRAVALGTAERSEPVRVIVRQRLALRASVAPAQAGPARRLQAGTTVTFEAVVRPARPELARPTVEFALFQRVGGTWTLDRTVAVAAAENGIAVAPLRFDLPGQWYVRARATPGPGVAASAWSQIVRYDVAGVASGPLERSWHAALAGGSATLSWFADGSAILAVNVTGLPRSAAVAIAIHRGGCPDVGPRVVSLPGARTARDGGVVRSARLGAAPIAALARAAESGDALALVLRAGSATRCAPVVARPIVVARIATGEEAAGVAVDRAAVWVSNIFEDTISRIDPAANAVTATVAVPAYPTGIASDGASVFVSHVAIGMLSRVDARTLAVVDTIAIGSLPGRLLLAGGALWAVLEGDDEVVKVDPVSLEILARIGVAPDPHGIAESGGVLWVTSPRAGVITRIDAVTGEVVAEFDVPGVVDVAVGSGGIWASVRSSRAASGAVVRLDPATGEVAARVAVGFDPAGMAVVGGTVHVAMSGEPTLVQVRDERVMARLPVTMKSSAIAVGFGSLWLLHPYGAAIPGSGLFDGGVSRLNI